MARREITSAIVVWMISGCGGTTVTGTERHVDIASGGDAAVEAPGNGSGAALGVGGGAESGGGGAGGGDPCAGVRCASPMCPPGSTPVPLPGQCCPTSCSPTATDAGVIPACCRSDTDCKGDPGSECVNTMCLQPALAGCWRDGDCLKGLSCSGALVCPCNADCSYSAIPGKCGPPSTDASVDSGPSTCLPAPTLPPTSPTCTDLPYKAAAESYVVWISDPTAPGGGHTLVLATNQAVTAGGHTYENTGAGLVGAGAHGIYGDALFDVDGVANALSFHFEGCATPVSPAHWELVAAVTRNGPFCSSCPETIERRYTIRQAASGTAGRYVFDAEGKPQGCGLGADLYEITLYQ